MDVEILARVQFAITIMFHYIYPPLSIGLGLILVIMEGIYIKTREPIWETLARFWTKVFALTFALGVATGIVMEFEFGTNWATYSRYVGDVFGSALAAEGVFAFFLESGFLALLLFGWDRIGPKLHYFATWMVALGAHFSAVWIIVANSWMQTPAGFHIVGDGLNARAEIVDFWAMVFNPSSVDRLTHSIVGAWLAGAFLVMSVSAYYLLRKKHMEFATRSLKVGLVVALVSCALQLYIGDRSAKGVAVNQPAKLAAFEALYTTQRNAPLQLFGLPNSQEAKLDYAFGIPGMLSYLSFGKTDAEVLGLDQVPKQDWPNVKALFPLYRLMIGCWLLMTVIALIAAWKWYRGTLVSSKWMLRTMMFAVFLPQIGNQAGWVCAEMGRYPWIVQGLLRISQGLSKSVSANQVLGSMIMFSVLYFFLFLVFLYLLNEKIKGGPAGKPMPEQYRHLHEYVEEIKQDAR